MGKSYADGYLIRDAAGNDYDEQKTLTAAKRVADRLGRGAKVLPLRPGSPAQVMTTPGGNEIVSYTVR